MSVVDRDTLLQWLENELIARWDTPVAVVGAPSYVQSLSPIKGYTGSSIIVPFPAGILVPGSSFSFEGIITTIAVGGAPSCAITLNNAAGADIGTLATLTTVSTSAIGRVSICGTFYDNAGTESCYTGTAVLASFVNTMTGSGQAGINTLASAVDSLRFTTTGGASGRVTQLLGVFSCVR